MRVMNHSAVIQKLRAACRRAGGQARWAMEHGISPAYVSDVLGGRRDPGPKILTPLGLVVTTSYTGPGTGTGTTS